MRWIVALIAVLSFAGPADLPRHPFLDCTYRSKVFGEERHYRLFLPPDYDTSHNAYPVIYYFHGHGDRYTLEQYDEGKDTVPKIAAFVANHPVIVVAVDGYVARDYLGFYGGTPWDIMRDGGDFDFGPYFRELVTHIDRTYRTLSSRRFRATSGLSMGGFMSLYLSARYPDLIGSASAFNPGPEFYTGDKGQRVLWRPKDHVANHTHTMVRLVRASGDWISEYTEETRDEYARADNVDFEFRQDEYHRHWATSIGETFEFHMRAFAQSNLDNVPATWSHDDAYSDFTVWGYHVKSVGNEPAITRLEDVSRGGWRVTTRKWAPDGPAAAARRITIMTAPLYEPGASYLFMDHNISTGNTAEQTLRAGATGRLTITTDGVGHQFSLTGPGAADQPPVLLPLTSHDLLRLPPNQDVALPIRIYNPRHVAMTGVKTLLSSDYATVQVLRGESTVSRLEAGAAVDLSSDLHVRFTAGHGYFARARLKLVITCNGGQDVSANVDVLITPEDVPPPMEVMILDGRPATLNVFRQKGNIANVSALPQGGGGSVPRTVTEGHGNANGVLEPGEEATIWVHLHQGMDPFDKNNWYRAKVFSDSPWVTEIGDVEERKQLEWTSAMERTSVIRLSLDTPHGTRIPLLLDNESWSFWWTPDVRYGVERLFQAFQLHTHHLHRYELVVP